MAENLCQPFTDARQIEEQAIEELKALACESQPEDSEEHTRPACGAG
jgi:hypothetical protein